MPEKKIGVVIHYWGKIHVAGLRITDGELKIGDTIHIKGHTSDFTQPVDSMHVEDQNVDTARPGDEIGLRVKGHAREHDEVFKVMPE